MTKKAKKTGRDDPPPEAAPPEADSATVEEPAAGEAATAESSAVDELTADAIDPLKAARAELRQAVDRDLRCRAELENYRKRVAREMEEQRRYANLPLMRDLFPVMDNLHRVIEAAEKTHDTASLLQGVKMAAQQFGSVLEKHHCTRIAALDEPFDPHLHEAVSQQPSGEHPANTVLLETQTGFQLHDRVVRPSQVIVSSLPPKDE